MNFSDEDIRRQMRLGEDSGVVWHTGIMYKRGQVNRWTQAGLCW